MSTLWSRRKFLRLSAAAVLGAGLSAVERGVSPVSAHVESPSQNNPFSAMLESSIPGSQSSSGERQRWQFGTRAELSQNTLVTKEEVEREINKLVLSKENQEGSSSSAVGGLLSEKAAKEAIAQQAEGIAGFLTDLRRDPSALFWSGTFAEGSQPGIQLNPIVDQESGAILFLLKSQSGEKDSLQTQLVMPNYLRSFTQEREGFEWLPSTALDRSGSGRFIPINADPSKYQFRVKQMKKGWLIERDEFDQQGVLIGTAQYNAKQETLEKVNPHHMSSELPEVLGWKPEQVQKFLDRVIPIVTTKQKQVPWGITKTSTELNGDEYIFGAIFHSYGQEKVTVKSSMEQEFSADLHYLNLLVPNAKKTKLIPVKFYLYQNMLQGGTKGYTMVDPVNQRIPAERGGSISTNPIPLLLNTFEKMQFGTTLAILSPAAGIQYSDAEYASHFSSRPEAVVAFMKNGKENSSYKKAQENLRKELPAQVYAAGWM